MNTANVITLIIVSDRSTSYTNTLALWRSYWRRINKSKLAWESESSSLTWTRIYLQNTNTQPCTVRSHLLLWKETSSRRSCDSNGNYVGSCLVTWRTNCCVSHVTSALFVVRSCTECTVIARWHVEERRRIQTQSASSRHTGRAAMTEPALDTSTLCLFDVDGTLTAARQVCVCVCIHLVTADTQHPGPRRRCSATSVQVKLMSVTCTGSVWRNKECEGSNLHLMHGVSRHGPNATLWMQRHRRWHGPK